MRAIVAAVVLPLAVIAPPAEAGQLTFRIVDRPGPRGEPGRAVIGTYVAGPGESNVVDIRYAGGTLRLRDSAGVRAVRRCRVEAGGGVACSLGNPLVRLEATLADGDDVLVATDGLALDAEGGEGGDRLTGGGRLDGGPGDDQLHSRAGPNVLAGGTGADLLDPAGGGTLDYSDRTAGVKVDMRGDAAAGEPGEGDVLLPGATGFVGGSGADLVIAPDTAGHPHVEGRGGDDRLVGSAVAGNSADGGPGDDWITGGARYDRLEGERGSDVLVGGGDFDELFADSYRARDRSDDRNHLQGDAGRDYLDGGRGRDTLDGGAGRDSLTGDAGVDLLLARDGVAEEVRCAGLFDEVPVPGHDVAILDRHDDQRSCGLVERTGPPAAELLGAADVRSQRRRRSGLLHAYVGCPAAAPARGCDAVVGVAVYPQRERRCALRLPAGSRRRVRFAFDLRAEARSRDVGIEVRLRSREPSGRLRRQEAWLDSAWPRPLIPQAPPAGGTVDAAPARCRR